MKWCEQNIHRVQNIAMLSNMCLSFVALVGQDEKQRCPLIYHDLFQNQANLHFFPSW